MGVTSLYPSFSPVNRLFALYKSVNGKHGACLIGYLCTLIFAPFIRVDEFSDPVCLLGPRRVSTLDNFLI